MADSTPRIRARLLVLIWIWTLCISCVVDLFLNVSAFDRIRPRARLYGGMRMVAHDMVGEGLPREEASVSLRPCGLRDQLRQVQEASSPDRLRFLATEARDSRCRILALERLVLIEGEVSIEFLVNTIDDRQVPQKVRADAARLLGHIGATDALDAILAGSYPPRIRGGAVRGLARLGTPTAAKLLIGLATEAPSVPQRAAVDSIATIRDPRALPTLRETVLNRAHPAAVRVAACRAIGRSGKRCYVPTLVETMSDPDCSTQVRSAAADSLGRLGDAAALEALTSAASSGPSGLARTARHAAHRIRH